MVRRATHAGAPANQRRCPAGLVILDVARVDGNINRRGGDGEPDSTVPRENTWRLLVRGLRTPLGSLFLAMLLWVDWYFLPAEINERARPCLYLVLLTRLPEGSHESGTTSGEWGVITDRMSGDAVTSAIEQGRWLYELFDDDFLGDVGVWAPVERIDRRAVRLEPVPPAPPIELTPAIRNDITTALTLAGAPCDATMFEHDIRQPILAGYVHNAASLVVFAALLWSLGWVLDVPHRVRARVRAARVRRIRRALHRQRCPWCSYSIDGLSSMDGATGVEFADPRTVRCPECGRSLMEEDDPAVGDEPPR
ncbi:MAG: hypothetical protein SFZ23_12600 [Planctomycetota bacterium]|nr:hypothetical protein [Planctomycetota bacterium]